MAFCRLFANEWVTNLKHGVSCNYFMAARILTSPGDGDSHTGGNIPSDWYARPLVIYIDFKLFGRMPGRKYDMKRLTSRGPRKFGLFFFLVLTIFWIEGKSRERLCSRRIRSQAGKWCVRQLNWATFGNLMWTANLRWGQWLLTPRAVRQNRFESIHELNKFSIVLKTIEGNQIN